MKPKVKTSLILLATLVIGFLLGALSMITLRRYHMERFGKIREQQAFMFFHERLIQPTEGQQDTVKKILSRYSPRFYKVVRQHREQISVLRDSLMLELETVLTPEQMKRLKQRAPFKRFPPGPGGPPFIDRTDRHGQPMPPPGMPPPGMPPPEKHPDIPPEGGMPPDMPTDMPSDIPPEGKP
ncbi:hypothetical protein JW935_25635 [candidate division KSB1 bacterium]|nr:hypothetical protein [candidate division KSB1 bacterium]